jgi:hypothetical protein
MNTPQTNNPSDILSSWLALEVLSPQTFVKPEDLTSALGSVAYLNEEGLPWEKDEQNNKPKYRLYYQVIVGSIHFEKAVSTLLDIYTDKRPERPVVKGEAILASIIIDTTGKVVGQPSISSFGWGLARALQNKLTEIAQWSTIEQELSLILSAFLNRKDKNGNQVAVNRQMIEIVRNTIIEKFELPVEYVTNNCFAIRTYQYFTNPEPPEPLLLNSFFLGDLTAAGVLFKGNKATANLQKYLKVRQPATRTDLLHATSALETVISPGSMPLARWPGKGRHPLVLLQQAAVNITFNELKVDGILAVNGPPGTGKTTLLRDIIAGVVTRRAEAMCSFADPADAFEDSGEKISMGQGVFRLHRIDTAIKGFEMLITSSNNKAVENVSAELPGLQAVAEDAPELRYFTSLSDLLINRDSWGLIAAVMGNAMNLNNFRQKFWWDKEVGINTYLMAASGTPQVIEAATEGRVESRRPRIIEMENPPDNRTEALIRWEQAKSEFQIALQKSRHKLELLEEVRQAVLRQPVLEEKEASAKQRLSIAASYREKTSIENLNANGEVRECLIEFEQARLKVSDHLKLRPGWLARFFRTQSARVWKKEHELYEAEYAKIEEKFNALQENANHKENLYKDAVASYNESADQHHQAKIALDTTQKNIEQFKEVAGPHLIDRNFFRTPHEKRHLVTPWCDKETQLLRDNVFIKAIQLHKAFINAAAKPLRHNLRILMDNFSGQGLTNPQQLQLLPDLWTSLFLVVPCISTTFASVSRMLGKLPPESLGWLLIDEAGQALPQAAVGAIMRTKRAVVVGDPVQIEPVVILPEILTQNICRSFGVDPLLFNAPVASAQTLADAATPYYAEFEGKLGTRAVGVPLLVHRRCEDPMFSISNAIAYERLMVKSKAPCLSNIENCLGQSQWIHVETKEGHDKWSLNEGIIAITMLEKLKEAGISPDLYIVTPFVLVADRIRSLIRDSGVLESWVEKPERWPYERVGTVHTVQGREAEAVIFVLGAPLQTQGGARNWAGAKPNLVNVAVTRAKEVLYVIGNRELWKSAGVFRELTDRLPIK